MLKEVNRLLRYNGYFVYSAPPAYRKDKNYPLIWEKLVNIASSMCWNLIAKRVQTAIWIKQENQSCLLQNADQNVIKICDDHDVNDSKPSWRTPLRNCIRLSTTGSDRHKLLLPRPERLSLYSESLSHMGFSLSFHLFIFCCDTSLEENVQTYEFLLYDYDRYRSREI